MSLPEGAGGIAVVLFALGVDVRFKLFLCALIVSDRHVEYNVFSDYRGLQKTQRHINILGNYMQKCTKKSHHCVIKAK